MSAIKKKPTSVVIAQAILSKASKVIGGQRQEDYGTPDDSFQEIANLFNAMGLERNGNKIEKTDTPMAMVMLKLAREFNRPKLDNIVDTCGYAALHGGVTLRDAFEKFDKLWSSQHDGPRTNIETSELMKIARTVEIYELFEQIINERNAGLCVTEGNDVIGE